MILYDNTGVTVELGDIVASGVNIWDFDYPVPRSVVEYNGKTCKVDFDKKTFEQKVIDHYRFRQIGQETVGRFLHYFRTKIREIMPYYVQVYEFDAKFRNIEDPLESYNLVETFQQETNGSGRIIGSNSSESSGTSSGSVNTGGNTVSKFSDTPQGEVKNIDNHLTNATVGESEDHSNTSGTSSEASSGSSEQDSQSSGNTSHTLTRKGNIGVQPLGGEVLNIRSAFINIDMQIIEELSDLFLKVY